jgi:prevent-host-death family protein
MALDRNRVDRNANSTLIVVFMLLDSLRHHDGHRFQIGDFPENGQEYQSVLIFGKDAISYLKAHASEVIRALGEQREALIITQNGEAKAVLQDVQSYEQTQETLALLRILALGNR